MVGVIEKRSKDSTICIGEDCLINGFLVAEKDRSEIQVGNRVAIGSDTIIDCVERVEIHDDVLISYQCLILDSNYHAINSEDRLQDLMAIKKNSHDWSKTSSMPVLIKRSAWIGARVIILKGVIIGEGSVIGAGSVVTTSIPDYAVAAGNPAKVIRYLREDV